MKIFRALAGFFALFCASCVLPLNAQASLQAANSENSAKLPVRVLLVGASVAKGWHDSSGPGYLGRAFQNLSHLRGTPYEVYNQAIPGAKIADVSIKYKKWLATYHPQIVVLSWGLVNDLNAHTPTSKFLTQLQAEIQEALNSQAFVMVVSPPVSVSSYVRLKNTQSQLVNSEMKLVEKMHNPNVVSINLYEQMKAYLRQHNRKIQTYCSEDRVHPNTRGHILAAQLLTPQLVAALKNNSINESKGSA